MHAEIRKRLVYLSAGALTVLVVIVVLSRLGSRDNLAVFMVEPTRIGFQFFLVDEECSEDDGPWHAIYKSSDGVRVFAKGATHVSLSEAENDLRKELVGAAKILDRVTRYDGKRQKVWQRVVAMKGAKEAGQPLIAIMGTDGRTFYSIESTSMSHLLEFDRRGIKSCYRFPVFL